MWFGIALYAGALILANLLIVVFGKWISPFNAFLLIGLDLVLRDVLHCRLKPLGMLGLIVGTGVVTYFLNPAAESIAVASVLAFMGAAVVDWAIFAALRGRSWFFRSNASNVGGALVDSVLFPTIAFGAVMPGLIALQFLAKVAGGFVWASLLRHLLVTRESR